MSTDAVVDPEPQDLESTWASRNPVKPVICPRNNMKKNITHAEKIAAHGRRLVTQEKAEALQQAIQTCLAMREAEVKHLAKEHGRKSEYIKRLLNHGTNYTSNRRPSFYNVLVHHLAKEINEGKATIPYGAKLT